MVNSAFRSCWWKTFRSLRKGGEEEKKEEKGEGKKGRKGRPLYHLLAPLLLSSSLNLRAHLVRSISKSLLLQSSAVVQCLLVIKLLKRLSFPFTYFATQNARKVRGNCRKVIKKTLYWWQIGKPHSCETCARGCEAIWWLLLWYGCNYHGLVCHTDQRWNNRKL